MFYNIDNFTCQSFRKGLRYKSKFGKAAKRHQILTFELKLLLER